VSLVVVGDYMGDYLVILSLVFAIGNQFDIDLGDIEQWLALGQEQVCIIFKQPLVYQVQCLIWKVNCT
jgi:hypothetical protein